MSFSPHELWAHMGLVSKFIFFLLIAMSVAAVYVAVERWFTFAKARKQSRELAEAIDVPLAKLDVGEALRLIDDIKFRFAFLGRLLRAGLVEMISRPDRQGLEASKRALERTALAEGHDLKRGMAILATVGSTAPFVGLVGTIFGIINAFSGMAESGSGGLASVSAGIAEALVATAVGIAVAIIGVWLFNFFNEIAEGISADMSLSIQEFVDWGEKLVLSIEEGETAGFAEGVVIPDPPDHSSSASTTSETSSGD